MKFESKKNGQVISPSTEIIGKNREINPVTDFNPKIELDPAEETNYAANAEYNSKINDHSELVTNLAIRDNYVLVRLFKYDQESISTGGIILEDIETYTTAQGQMKAKVRDISYQRRGIIVKAGHMMCSAEWSDLLKPGAIVHIPDNKLKEHHVDKRMKTDNKHGYFMINIATIEAVELV